MGFRGITDGIATSDLPVERRRFVVMGRDGHGRHGFGCWVACVSAGAPQPESDSECPLSLQHAVGRGVAPKGEASRVSRASFLEVSPRSRGKDEPRQGQRPATDARPRSTSQAARFRSLAMACHQRASGAQAHDCPGFDTTWQGVSQAGRVRDCVVRARVLIVKTDSRGVHLDAPSSELRQ